jgi:hypothetical protein
MAVLITIALVTVLVGTVLGAFLKLSFAIRREDRSRGSLRSDASDSSAKAARSLVGLHGSRWDQ